MTDLRDIAKKESHLEAYALLGLLILGGIFIGTQLPVPKNVLYGLVSNSVLSPDGEIIFKDNYNVSWYKGFRKFILEFDDENSCMDIKTAGGKSMNPIYSGTNYVLVDYCYLPEKVDIGDVIVFSVPDYNTPIHHRVTHIDIENKRFVTKGDNNPRADDWIDWNQMIAKEIIFIDAFDEGGKE